MSTGDLEEAYMARATRTRLTAEERTEQLVGAAVTAFATAGYKGTSTDDVARLAGVSQPYVIRLFGSKQKLFLAAVEQACGRIEQAFREALAEKPELSSVGEAYSKLLTERELMAILLHGYAAAADPGIGPVVRAGFGRIYSVIRDGSGASDEDVRNTLAYGMLLTVLASMQLIGPDAVPPEAPLDELVASIMHDKDC
jgi:AcrR family transcriptional regulator